MWKLNKAEINKIFMRPAVYIMVAVIAVALVIIAMLYSPKTREPNEVNIASETDTVAVAFSKFENSTDIEFSKINLDNKLTTVHSGITNFSSSEHALSFLKTNIDSIITTMTTQTGTTFSETLKLFITEQSSNNKNALINSAKELKSDVNKVYGYLSTNMNEQNMDFYITKADLDSLKTFFRSFLLSMPTDENWQTLTNDEIITHSQNILNSFTPTKQKEFLDNCKTYDFSAEDIDAITENYFTNIIYTENSETPLTLIYKSMSEFVASHSEDISAESKNILNSYIVQYKNVVNCACELITSSFNLLKTSGYNDIQLRNYIGFETYNSYKINETITLNNYLLDNKVYDGNYLLNFNFNTPSGYAPSAYDFTVFAMQILSIILIVFAVFFGVSIVAGDMQNGTIKMLATRPYSRTKIMSGKTLACFNFILFFALFCLIASFVIGIAMFGFGSGGNVLMVINSTAVVSVPAFVSLLIYFATILINIIFYIVLAILLATIFKNSALATSLTTAVLLANVILSSFFSTATWFIFTPFAYLDFFKFFGGSSLTNGFLTLTIPTGLNLLVCGMISLALIIIMDVVSKIIFENRDIA